MGNGFKVKPTEDKTGWKEIILSAPVVLIFLVAIENAGRAFLFSQK